MRIAYILLVHRLPDQVLRLVRRIDGPAVSFFIHVDSATDDATYQAMVDSCRSNPNVEFLPRFRTSWASWEMVEATFEGLRAVIRSGQAPDFVVLLSGQDYPLRTAAQIDAFFAAHRGTSFIDLRALPDYSWNPNGALKRFESCEFPEEIGKFGGGQWWALSGDCAAYVTAVADGNAMLMEQLNRVSIPDEHVIHTIIGNSPFRERVSRVPVRPVYGVHYIDWTRGSPKSLAIDDLERLQGTPALFARKFDLTRDAQILDAIDAFVDERALSEENDTCNRSRRRYLRRMRRQRPADLICRPTRVRQSSKVGRAKASGQEIEGICFADSE